MNGRTEANCLSHGRGSGADASGPRVFIIYKSMAFWETLSRSRFLSRSLPVCLSLPLSLIHTYDPSPHTNHSRPTTTQHTTSTHALPSPTASPRKPTQKKPRPRQPRDIICKPTASFRLGLRRPLSRPRPPDGRVIGSPLWSPMSDVKDIHQTACFSSYKEFLFVGDPQLYASVDLFNTRNFLFRW